MPKCAFCGVELGAARPRAPHRLCEDPVPYSRPRLPPPPHHRGRGGRRRGRRGQATSNSDDGQDSPLARGSIMFPPRPTYANAKPSEPVQSSRSNSLHPETVGSSGLMKLLC